MVRHCCGALHLHLCCRLCVVLGASWLACAKWNFPSWNSISCSEYQCLSEYALHLCCCSSLLANALSLQVRFIPLLRLLCGVDDNLYLLFLAWNKGNPHWRNGSSMEDTLVLVPICWSKWFCVGWKPWNGQRKCYSSSKECVIKLIIGLLFLLWDFMSRHLKDLFPENL